MTLTSGTEQLLQLFILLAALLLIPVAVGIVVVLFKLAFLLHSAHEFLTLASYELTPVIKDLRRMVNHLEDLGHKASNGVSELGNSLGQAQPLLKRGFQKLTVGTTALLTGIGRSFSRSPES